MPTALWLGVLAAAALPGGCNARPTLSTQPDPCSGGISATKIRVTRVDKIDLLIVVDNSLSMADKQSELGRRMPALVKALTNPDPEPSTGRPKWKPIADLHVGVISSSLGSHGTSACHPSIWGKHNDDRGHLLPRDGEGSGTGWKVDADGSPPTSSPCPTPVAASPVTWVFDATRGPGTFVGAAGSTSAQTAVSCVVQSVKEDGCGYEETLEAAYHFLIDPAPYASAEVKCTFGVSGDACGSNKIVVAGTDAELLAQRKAFLRTDSLLAVVLLTDENDVSLKPASLNWLPWGSGRMFRGWEGCAKVPDDFEPESGAEYDRLHKEFDCYSCFESPLDPNCKVPWPTDTLNTDIDGRNVRGFHQVQRFGYNFLWSRSRYVRGFTAPTVLGSDGKVGVNPIYAGGFRSSDLVIVAGIVGVPRKLVEDSTGPKTLTPADWELIVSPDLSRRDPHMIESIAPRTDRGVKLFAGDRTIDDVNGGDRDIPDGDDLQYACIARRATDEKAGDCEGTNPETKNPLCAAGGKQPFFKAYPGLRHLRVIRELGTSGYVASICSDSYAPAIKGITDKLQAVLSAQCLKTVLDADATGNVNCLILEGFAGPDVAGKTRCEDVGRGYCTPGAKPCRLEGGTYPPLTAEQAAAQLALKIQVVDSMGVAKDEKVQATSEGGNVYATGSDGKKHLICEVVQLAGGRVPDAETKACLGTPDPWTPSLGGGWCYTQDPAIVGEACIMNGAPGKIRLFGDTVLHNGSEQFTLCVNASPC